MDVNKVKSEFVIAIGASTGGKDAIYNVFENFPKEFPPVLVVQHMIPGHTTSYVRRLKKSAKLRILESEDGIAIEKNTIYIAPAEYQMRIVKIGGVYRISLSDEGYYKENCPSIDILFNSVAEVVRDFGIGAILSGTGTDGAQGLLQMRKMGAFTIAQDEKSSIAFGMPKAAIDNNAVLKKLHLNEISKTIIDIVNNNYMANYNKKLG